MEIAALIVGIVSLLASVANFFLIVGAAGALAKHEKTRH